MRVLFATCLLGVLTGLAYFTVVGLTHGVGG